jgi:hypothetical protein
MIIDRTKPAPKDNYPPEVREFETGFWGEVI